jgi:tRNA dimethylallyltransferase
VYEPLESLRPRLGKRVDKMVENGLLQEIAELRKIAKEVYGREDHTEGIFQSIGRSPNINRGRS